MASTVGVPRLRGDTSVGEAISSIREFGAVIIERLVSAEVMDAIAAELAQHMGATQLGNDDFSFINSHDKTEPPRLLRRLLRLRMEPL